MQKSKLQFKIKIQNLRKQYPKFIYQDYFYKLKRGNLEISFLFKIGPNIRFRPEIIIKNVKESQLKMVKGKALNSLIFNLGLMEIPSYWKATCSPEIVIKSGSLSKEQIKWWKDLIIKGMGQFFYENKIDWRSPKFLKIKCQSDKKYEKFNKKLKNNYLVPFAGGRDSIVTLESLKPASDRTSARQRKKDIALFMVNPNEQILKTAKISGVRKQIVVKRTVDKKLLELNRKGYLNGHTPFTALLSFLSVFCAVLFNYKNVVFSNEKSANEGNVKYLGRTINHQWAKSSEFEKMFKDYCRKYLAKNVNYFSFLRKYGDLEISKMLAGYPQYFPVFSSCNSSMRIVKKRPASAKSFGEARWCGNCPKCLFVYLTLYPFLNEKELFTIFGKDIFQNRKLLPVMKALIGKGRPKPFECVGTQKESREALKLCLKKAGKAPYLLKKV